MKIIFRSFTVLATLGLSPLACEVHQPDLAAVQQFCAQAGWAYDDDGKVIGNYYEFESVWRMPILDGGALQFEDGKIVKDEGVGSFETNGTGTLIVDDDDLTDDFEAYNAAKRIAEEHFKAPNADGLIETYAAASPSLAAERTPAEEEAIAFVEDLVNKLIEVCPRFGDDVAPRPGMSVRVEDFPYFSACKDKFNEGGDGVIGAFELDRADGARQDQQLAECPTLSGGENANAMNFWGPLTTRDSKIDGLPNDVIDGFTYSGLTVSVHEAPWKGTDDKSEWEGIAFWARLASPEEAIAIPEGVDAPTDARPQEGVGQLGVSVQTMDTASVYDSLGNVTEIHRAPICSGDPPISNLVPNKLPCFTSEEEFESFEGLLVPSEDPDSQLKYAFMASDGSPVTPQLPFCDDYVPNDAQPGEEPGYRDHCWDGFRTMQEITPKWQFYFFPFDEMRQAGWGRVAKTFRLDHIKSISLLTSAYQPINVMVDEVAFYRSRRSEQAQAAAAAMSQGGAGAPAE